MMASIDELDKAMAELRKPIDPEASKMRARTALIEEEARRKDIFDRGFEAGRVSVDTSIKGTEE